MARINLRDYLREIDDLIDAGRTDEAIAHSRYILELYPKHVETYRLLGKAYLEIKRYSDAADVLQRVLSSIPDDFISHLGMSIIREDENNFDAAIWHMERAFEMQPSNAAIQEELRRLYGRRDGLEPTKIHLTRGALARMYAKGDLHEQAIAEINATLAQEPQRTDLKVLLAKMYAEIGQSIDSIKICSNILQTFPNCKEAIIILAKILPGTERAEEAANYHRRLQALDPYAAHISPSLPTPEQVPDNVITIERLEWTPGDTDEEKDIRPDWAASLGVEIETGSEDEEDFQNWLVDSTDMEKTPAFTPESLDIETASSSDDLDDMFVSESLSDQEDHLSDTGKTEEEAPEPEKQIPDFMQSAGWELSEDSSDEPSLPLEFEDESDDIEDGISPGQIPEWLQSMSPHSMDADVKEQEGVEESLKGASVNWLDEQTPGATDSIVTWLTAKNLFDKDDNVGPTSDFASDFDESEDKLPPDTKSPENQQSMDEDIPDWLRDLGEVSKPTLPQEEIGDLDIQTPDMIQSSSDESDSQQMNLSDEIEDEDVHKVPIDEIPEWQIGDFQKQQSEPGAPTPSSKDQSEFEISFEEDATKWSEEISEEAQEIQELHVSKDGESIMDDQDKIPELSPEDEDAALSWLESLAAKQGADEEELLTAPDERHSAPPDWVQQLAAESESTEEQIEKAGDIPLQTGSGEAEDSAPDFKPESVNINEPDLSDETIEEPEGIPDWLLDLVEDTTLEEEEPVGSADELEYPLDEHAERPAEDFLAELDQETTDEPIVTTADSKFEEPPLTVDDTRPTIVSDQIDEVTLEPEDEAETVPVPEEELPDWLKDLEIDDESKPAAQEIDREDSEIPEWIMAEKLVDEALEKAEPSQADEVQEVDEETEILEPIMAEEADEVIEEAIEIPELSQAVELPEAEEEPEIPEWIMAEEADEDTLEIPEPSQAVEAPEGEEEPEIPEWVMAKKVEEDSIDLPEPSQAAEAPEAEEEPEIPEWIMAEEAEEATSEIPEPSHATEKPLAEEEPDLPEWVIAEEAEEATLEIPEPSQAVEAPEAGEEPEIPEWIVAEEIDEEVPEMDEEPVEGEMPSRINLNTASLDALGRLPSIGPVIAKTIIDYRETHGFFKDVDSLQDVPGIGPKTLETLWDLLYVDQEVETAPVALSREEETLNEGRNALDSGDISKAYDHYSKLIEEDQLLESVIEDLIEAQKQFPVDINIYELLGDAYMRTDQLQEAIDTYTKGEELLA
jgi:competence ComEA-like helix-hairpin-helix protein